VLIGLYFISPVFSKWVIASTKKEISYYFVIWLAVIAINLPYLNVLNSKIDLLHFTGYMGYVVLGYYLSLDVQPRRKIIGLFCYFLGVFVTAIGSYWLARQNGQYDGTFYSNLTPNVILARLALSCFSGTPISVGGRSTNLRI
jgi:surface polysaccharide O-acyltransferase-like enzyme